MRKAAVIVLLGLGLAAPAWAEEADAAAQAARWQDLKASLFGTRPVIEGTNVIALEAPARALDAATVPITIEMPPATDQSGRIKAVWLMVDGNPSPVAAAIHFGPAADPHLLKTRVRVEQYTLIHAVAETEDGRLFSAARFVKAAGGCAAPSTKDPAVAMSRLGRMKIQLEGNPAVADGSEVTANLLISHPNNNGMQMDQISHLYIPPRYIQDIDVSYGDRLVMRIDADISLSEDPVVTFGLRVQGDGPLHVQMQDSTHADFHQDFDLIRRS